MALSQLADFAEIVPVSATKGEQVSLLADLLLAQLPDGPPLYPEGELSDEPETTMIAEFDPRGRPGGGPRRAAALAGRRRRGARRGRETTREIRAEIFVERSSQKAIVIGRAGSRLKEVGTNARQQIEAMLGTKVHLELFVKVAKDWQRDPRQLRKLGF